jgi:hypothetical protein
MVHYTELLSLSRQAGEVLLFTVRARDLSWSEAGEVLLGPEGLGPEGSGDLVEHALLLDSRD